MELDLDCVHRYDPESVTTGRPASVVVPIVDAGPALLFTKRAEDLADHPGQMSFPGGRQEPADDHRRATAEREADEEVGLSADELAVVGRLDDIMTVTDFAVRPFVARIPDREYAPASREVAAVTTLSVTALCDPTNYTARVHDGRHVDYFTVDGHTVWGATARILVGLLALTTDWERPEQPATSSSDAEPEPGSGPGPNP
ncbi:MAG: NTP pyrophosphohydrolase [halophilic archaeon J07HX5]|nr:MAG: NTP pyrophosphohydrolase [halophilic archaeon J07HX5]